MKKENSLKLAKAAKVMGTETIVSAMLNNYFKISNEKLEELAADENYNVRRLIARNSKLSEETFKKLAEDKEEEVRIAVAKNLDCPDDIKINIIKRVCTEQEDEELDDYLYDVLVDVRHTDKMLSKLVKMKNTTINKYISQNPYCPRELLIELAEDETEEIRANVASNRKSPKEVLYKLAETYDSHEIDCSIACNTNCPEDLLRKLYIKYEDGYDEILYEIVSNPNCPTDIIRKLADVNNEGIRAIIASRKKIAIDLLRKLANDEDSLVRRNVASNSNCPLDLLDILSYDAEIFVRRNVASNPNTMDSTLYHLYTEDKDVFTMGAAGANIHAVHRFEFNLNSFYWIQLEGYAKNPNISEKEMFRILERIKYEDLHRKEQTLFNLAANESVTENILERIVEMIDESDYSEYCAKCILRNILNNSKVCNEDFFEQII